jgi:hypothetical protein
LELSPFSESETIPIREVIARLGLVIHRIGSVELIECPMSCHQGPLLAGIVLDWSVYCFRCEWDLNQYGLVSCVHHCSTHDAIRWLLSRPDLWRGPLFRPKDGLTPHG